MLKTIGNMLIGALVASFVGYASALVIGIPPPPAPAPGLVDGTWLTALASGRNYSFQSGISAAGTTQATATALSATVRLIEIDTPAASTGVSLPQCLAGAEIMLYNNGAQTLTVYPAVANNPNTAAQDTIGNGTS